MVGVWYDKINENNERLNTYLYGLLLFFLIFTFEIQESNLNLIRCDTISILYNSMSNQEITIIVADDHTFFRDGLVHVLELDKRYKVIDEAKDGEELIQKTRIHNPDLVIVDVEMPKINGIEAIKEIKSWGTLTEAVALSMHDNESIILKMLQAGAMGYLGKNISKEEIYRAIDSIVTKRQMYFPESTSRRMFQILEKSSLSTIKNPALLFSEKEIDVINMVCQDLTNKEIGESMDMSSRTIEGHSDRIMKKMNVRSVAGLVAFAFTNKLVKRKNLF